MNKKNAFIVVVKSQRKMALHEANNVTNAIFVVANFCQEIRFY